MNDYSQSASNPAQMNPTNWTTALTTIITALQAVTGGVTGVRPLIIVCGILPSNAFPAAPWATSIEDTRRQYNQASAAVCATRGVLYLSLDAFPAAGFQEGVHPSVTSGHPWIAQRVVDCIAGRT
jgi:hypothetical protein